MNYYIFDSETIGFLGDTLLIQYRIFNGKKMGDIVLHEVFRLPISGTLGLIEDMMDNMIVGYNLTFDVFHLAQTYNILKIYLEEFGDDLPNFVRYYSIIRKYGDISRPEKGLKSIYDICLKPKKALDLLLHGRESVFQGQMAQKPIYLRKFPKQFAEQMIERYLKTLPIPKIYFGRNLEKTNAWQIIDLTTEGVEVTPEMRSKRNKNLLDFEIDPNLVNIRLVFYPSTGLKAIAHTVLGYEDVLHFDDYDQQGLIEYGYSPISGNYREHISTHVEKWAYDKRERKYAVDDVVYTTECLALFYWVQIMGNSLISFKELDPEERMKIAESYLPVKLFEYGTGETNHVLACEVGNTFWSGYAIDRPLCEKLYKKAIATQKDNKKVLNYNSYRQALDYLYTVCDDIEKLMIENTRAETLEELWNSRKDYSKGLGERAKFILDARKNDKNLQILEKLYNAGRFHASFKVLGTKSNRMAGGAFGAGKMKGGGSINPQGINKKGGLRDVVTFKDAGFELEGGDFKGFEVSIMEAIYQDEQLKKDLQDGKKFHALWGMELYGMEYDEILEEENEDIYGKAKQSVFAEAYGADLKKLAEVTGLSEEEVDRAKQNFQKKYTGIGAAKKRIKGAYTCIGSNSDTGRMEWVEPLRFVESLLGFKRYFEMDFDIIHFVFDLATNLPEEFVSDLEYERKEGRIQTSDGAIRSSLFACCFSLMSAIIRAAGNHEIQSVGGEITKRLQERFWELQPQGCLEYMLKPFNVHDEIDIPHKLTLSPKIAVIRDDFVEEYQATIPLLGIDWAKGNNWHDVHVDAGVKVYKEFIATSPIYQEIPF